MNNFTGEKHTAAVMVNNLDWDTDAESLLVDITGRRGQAVIYLVAKEDASVATSKKLDIGVHNVASDSVTPSTDNKVGAFTQIVGSNSGGTVSISDAVIVNLEGLEGKYLQCNMVETSTWEGFVTIVAILPDAGYLPTTLEG